MDRKSNNDGDWSGQLRALALRNTVCRAISSTAGTTSAWRKCRGPCALSLHALALQLDPAAAAFPPVSGSVSSYPVTVSRSTLLVMVNKGIYAKEK